MDRLLSKPELTALLGVSRVTIVAMMQRGCPYLRLGNGSHFKVRFELEKVMSWLEANAANVK